MESRITDVLIGGRNFKIQVFSTGRVIEEDIISPGLMATGSLEDVRKIYSGLPMIRCGENELMYTFLGGKQGFGDYTTPRGQDEFKEISLVLVDKEFSPPDWANELHEFAALKSNKIFKVDNILVCIRDICEINGRLTFSIGPGFYSRSFFSNGSGGMKISFSSEEKEKLINVLSSDKYSRLVALSAKLELLYGKNQTMREIVAAKFLHSHGLPTFGSRVYNNNIGVSCIILTSDERFIYAKRGKGVSVHQGIGASASGAAGFNKEALSKGLPYGITYEMCREFKEEVGVASGTLLLGSMQERIKINLGVESDEYEIIPIAFVCELLRGGKPECWFLVKYCGTVEDLVAKIRNNRDPGKAEIDELIYAQPAGDAALMIQHREADGFLSHVLLAELYLTTKYLSSRF